MNEILILEPDHQISARIQSAEPLQTSAKQFLEMDWTCKILMADSALLKSDEIVQKILSARKKKQFQKLILLYDRSTPLAFDNKTYNLLEPQYFWPQDELNEKKLLQLREEIQQAEQDENYLLLSTELNAQYEQIKSELQNELNEKTKNLVESRRQIFEINNRFELLRKALFITSRAKDLISAEASLNELLSSQQKITWLKIIKTADSERFQKELSSSLESTFKKISLVVDDISYDVFFFKGDKKTFKKSDLDFFVKLCETIQINLNRAIKITNLTTNERLFDLAFHSSPQFIMVIDQDYNILQANLAVEKIISEELSTPKCYQVLFNRTAPCENCQRGQGSDGQPFQIQHQDKTFRVQSKIYESADDLEKSVWVHLYEDISEQTSLEFKFQQTARLAELGLISSSIAHELNNPLGGIISYLQIMKLDLPQQHPFHADLQMMSETAHRMKKIIEDLLIFSRKEDIPTKEATLLEDLLQKNIDMLQVQLRKENLNIVITDEVRATKIELSPLHFRSSIHLVLQYLIQRQKTKKLSNPPFVGLVEVKIFHSQLFDTLIFSSNSGPVETNSNTKDLSLMALEKSLIDQGFQALLADDRTGWIKIEIKLPKVLK